jgi:hypothetical protein
MASAGGWVEEVAEAVGGGGGFEILPRHQIKGMLYNQELSDFPQFDFK